MKLLRAAAPLGLVVTLAFACKTNNISDTQENPPTDGGGADSTSVDAGEHDSSVADTGAAATDSGLVDAPPPPSPTFTTNPAIVRVVLGGDASVQIDMAGDKANESFSVAFQGANDGGIAAVTSTTASVTPSAPSATVTVSAAADGGTGVTTGSVIANGAVAATVPLVVAGTSGSPDTSFNGGDPVNAGGVLAIIPPGGGKTGVAYFVATQSDGKIVIAGVLGGTSTAWALMRLNQDGSPDTSFDTNAENDAGVGGLIPPTVVGLSIDPSSGIIFVGGNDAAGNPAVLAVNTDGTPATGFGQQGGLWTYTMGMMSGHPNAGPTQAIAADGSRGVYIAWAPSATTSIIRHLDPTGTIQTGPGIAGSIAALATDPTGDLYFAADTFVDGGSVGPVAAVQYGHVESGGSLDTSFPGPVALTQPSAVVTLTSGVLNNAGGLVVMGTLSDNTNNGRPFGLIGGVALDGGQLFDATSNGFLLESTGYSTDGLARGAAQADGKVVFVGYGQLFNAVKVSYIGRVTTSGVPDDSFYAADAGGLYTLPDVAPYEDVAVDVYGRIVVVGGGLAGWSVTRLWP
jgi:hypothetical protein